MKRTSVLVGGTVAAVVLLVGSVAVAQNAPSAPSSARAVAAQPAAALDRADGWTLAQSDGPSSVPADARVTAPAPAGTTTVPVSLDQASIEQYWLWASGVEVTAHGLTPGSTARVSITFPSGTRKQWAPVTVDGDGTLVTRVRTLDVDPENTTPEAGVAQIGVETSAGESGAALLTVTTAPGSALVVRTDPASITQDAFLDTPVTVHASGLPPLTRVLFNLGMPDTSMFEVGPNEGLHSDEKGEFSYELIVPSVNAQVGTWLVSIQSGDQDSSGSTTFAVTPGAPRVADKTVTTAVPSIAAAAVAADPGLGYSVAGFLPFDTYEATLTTSRGVIVPLGISRTNGEGVGTNAILAPKGLPEGVYGLEARSTTTGHYATTTFRVTDSPGLPASTFSLSTTTIAAADLGDPAKGVVLVGADAAPGVELRVSLRDAGWNRMPLTVGADAYATVDEDGRVSLPLVTLETIAPGSYTVWAFGGPGDLAYNLRLPLQVTGDAAPTPSTTTPSAEQSGSTPAAKAVPSTRVTPDAPLAPIAPAAPLSSPRPAPAVPAPEPTGTAAPDPMDAGLAPTAQPIPSVPTR